MIDDDVSFRIGLAANLEDDEHPVCQYSDPREVPPDVLGAAQVVILDYQMVTVDGISFADRLHAARPEIAIVLVTAYWTVEIEAQVAARDFLQLCRKPMDYDELHALVHQVWAR